MANQSKKSVRTPAEYGLYIAALAQQGGTNVAAIMQGIGNSVNGRTNERTALDMRNWLRTLPKA